MENTSNELVKIISESGLEQSKAQILLSNFQNYFEIASEWEQKAKMLTVTNEMQRAEMKMAREGRLFLKEKRVAVENTRKLLKEQSLREGQTIDSIARILKNLIEPIEDHLEKQEKFIEIKEAAFKAERKEKRVRILASLQFDFTYTDLLNMPDEQFDMLVLRLENERDARIAAEKKAEEERIAREKAEAEERERVRLDNIRLKAEAEELERKMAEERAKAEAERKVLEEKVRKEREEAEAKRREIEEKTRKEREELERKILAEQEIARKEAEKAASEKAKLESELRAKAEAEERVRKAEADRVAAEKEAARKAQAAPDKEKLYSFATVIDGLVLPELNSPEADSILSNAKILLSKVSAYIREKTEAL